jgi:hypothetical protein
LKKNIYLINHHSSAPTRRDYLDIKAPSMYEPFLELRAPFYSLSCDFYHTRRSRSIYLVPAKPISRQLRLIIVDLPAVMSDYLNPDPATVGKPKQISLYLLPSPNCAAEK